MTKLFYHSALAVVLGAYCPISAQEPASTTATYIPGSIEVPSFVPPTTQPQPTQPLPDAEATFITRNENGRTITAQRGPASLAPDVPQPAPAPVNPTPPTPGFTLSPGPTQFMLSGTVYNRSVTLARWQHPQTREAYEAVLGFNLDLLAGLPTFIHQGQPYSAQIFLSHLDTQVASAQRLAALGRPPVSVPQIEADGYRITRGNPGDTTGTQPLLVLRDLYLAEKTRLIQRSEQLQAYRQQAKAWADAHPVPEAPPVFWFKPHRNSRYLTEQDRADQQQAAEQRALQPQEQGGAP